MCVTSIKSRFLITFSASLIITLVVMIFCFITLYDAHLPPDSYAIAICSVFNILLRVLQFYQKQNV